LQVKATENIAELRSYKPSASSWTYVKGYYEAGDGGGGMFFFDPATSLAEGDVLKFTQPRILFKRTEDGLSRVNFQYGDVATEAWTLACSKLDTVPSLSISRGSTIIADIKASDNSIRIYTENIRMPNIPEYPNNASATNAGLQAGAVYRTDGDVKVKY